MAEPRLFDTLTWDLLKSWEQEKARETLHLEFKRKTSPSNGKLEDEANLANVAKAMSAFANGGGGLLVLGVDAGGANGGDFDRIRQIEPIANVDACAGRIERDFRQWTDPVIASMRVKSLSPAPSVPGVVVIEVPESMGGPHRVTVGKKEWRERYYMRTGAGDVTMPHSQLADRFGRTAPPKLSIVFEIVSQPTALLAVQLVLLNEGRGAAIRPAVCIIPRAGDQTLSLLNWYLDTAQHTGFVVRAPAKPQHPMLLIEPHREVVVYPDVGMVVAVARSLNFVQPGFELEFNVAIHAMNAQPVRGRGTLRVGDTPAHVRIPAAD